MLNHFPLLTPSVPNSALAQHLWQKLVYPPLILCPDRTVVEAISLLKGIRIVCDASRDPSHSDKLDLQVRSSCVSIVENGQLIGILTERDVFRLSTERQNLDNLAIRDVMSTKIVTLRAADFTDISVAIDLLDRHHIRHLPVVDDLNCLVGLVTHESIQYHLAEALNAQVAQLAAENVRLLEQHTLARSERFEEQTSQLQAREARLQESQQFLQTVIETFPLAVFWKDRESRYLGCNYKFAQDANLNSPTEIVGKNDYDLSWGAIEGDAYRADDRLTIASGTAKLGIIETQTLIDGSSRWVETNKIPLRNVNGDTIGVLGTYQDITDRKQTEAQLFRLSERLSLSLKSGAVGCWEWDIIRDLLIWDDRMYELYGGKRSQPDPEISEAYATWIETIHPDDRPATEDLLAQAILGQAEFDTEFRVIHPDRSIHFIKAYGLVQRDERDRPCSMTGINFDITAAKHDEVVRKQNEQMIRQQAERELVLREITQRIRKSLDLKTIFETAVREIRHFMETDRVAIFQFNPDRNFDEGEFVAESVDIRFQPILGVKIDDPGFGERLAHFYQQGRINVLEDIHAAGLQADEIELLAKFQVQANLVVPLLNGQMLWGSICIHHCGTQRSWQESEINFVKQIAEQIGIGIQQATLYQKVQLELEIRWRAEEAIALQLRQQQTLGALSQQIRNSLNVAEILATATEQVKELMMVDRASIFQVSPKGHLQAVEEVVSPGYPRVSERNWDNEYLSNEEFEFYLNGNPNVVFDLKQDPRSASLQEYVDHIGAKSKIVVPILLLFGNSATDREIETWDEPHLWGLLSVHACGTHRRWQAAEVKLVQQIADQLALAIHQASLFEKLQQELTERQQAETRLLESNQQLAVSNQELARATQLKDEFLASMSHELRTPLNAILGLSESLQDEVFGAINERQQKSIVTIEKSGKHLLSLINDILDLSKIEANKFELELTDVSIQSLCQNSLLFIKELAHKRQIRLQTQLPESLKYLNIRVDDFRFRQVLINLLSNAVKFTPEGGNITLDVRVGTRGAKSAAGRVTSPMVLGFPNWGASFAGEASPLGGYPATHANVASGDPTRQVEHLFKTDGGLEGQGEQSSDATPHPELTDLQSPAPQLQQIAFSIIDTGIGIAAENMDKLFQSFVQIDSSLSRQYAGTGLGLALVKRIVEMHGGTVSVQSQVDRGSCFTISIPFDPRPEIALTPSDPLIYPLVTDSTPEQTLTVKPQTSILLVEDDEGNIETMTTYLQSRGYRIVVAENGRQAISILEACGKDLDRVHYPNIILMDIQMPGMDGFEAIRYIRQLPEGGAIPIIALTALAMPNDCQKCLDAGADRYVAKPVKLSQLVATIETLLNSR